MNVRNVLFRAECAAFGAWAGYGHDRLWFRKFTGSVVQILRIIKSFSSTLCIDLVSLFLPEVVCILLVG